MSPDSLLRSAMERPVVSVVLPTYNERQFIQPCLESILRQRTVTDDGKQFDLEILAIDGQSEDGTRQILEGFAATDNRLRVLINERRRTPFAFNLGVREARGEFVCIFGAHSVYRDDYISTCLHELRRNDAAACGGRVLTVPANSSRSARLAAWAMSHPFGSSGKSFRTQGEGPVDTVNYPLFVKRHILEAGGYDEALLRNQDNDLNQKIRRHGGILWCTWKTTCLYSPKGSLKGIFKYAFGNGRWNVESFLINPESMALRHWIPFFFVIALILAAVSLVMGLSAPTVHVNYAAFPILSILGIHLFVGSIAGLQLAIREGSATALLLPPVFLIFHISYGYGTLKGAICRLPKVRNLFLRHRAAVSVAGAPTRTSER